MTASQLAGAICFQLLILDIGLWIHYKRASQGSAWRRRRLAQAATVLGGIIVMAIVGSAANLDRIHFPASWIPPVIFGLAALYLLAWMTLYAALRRPIG